MALDLPLRLYSLGLRPQVSRLVFADLHQGTFLRPRIGFKHLLERAAQQLAAPITEKTEIKKETNLFLSGLGENAPFNNSDFSSWNLPETQTVFKKYEPVFSAFLDEGVSLIYFPVIPEAGKVVSLKDGLTGKLLGRVPEADWKKITARHATVIPPAGTLPLLCPNCGWDLKCEDESWAALCPGCGRLWGVSRGAEIGAAKTGFFSKLPKINPAIKAVSLIFLPFRKGGYEVSFNGDLTFAIPRNALKWGKRL